MATNLNTFIVNLIDGVENQEKTDGLIMRMIDGEVSRFEFERQVDFLVLEQRMNDMRHDTRILAAGGTPEDTSPFCECDELIDDCTCEYEDEDWGENQFYND